MSQLIRFRLLSALLAAVCLLAPSGRAAGLEARPGAQADGASAEADSQSASAEAPAYGSSEPSGVAAPSASLSSAASGSPAGTPAGAPAPAVGAGAGAGAGIPVDAGAPAVGAGAGILAPASAVGAGPGPLAAAGAPAVGVGAGALAAAGAPPVGLGNSAPAPGAGTAEGSGGPGGDSVAATLASSPDPVPPRAASPNPGPAPPGVSPAGPAQAASRDAGPPPYIRWEFRHPSRHKDGPAVAELFLVSGDGSPLEDASWFYRLLPLASYRELLATKDEPVMRAGSFGEGGNEAGEFAGARDPSPSVFRLGEGGGFKAEGGLKLSLASGSYVMADVMASAVVRGRRCYAQTAMLLFGDSMGARGPETNSGVPPWPSFDFVGSGDLYWPQTGNAFTLTARGWSPSGPVLAWGDGGPAAGEYAVAENGVSFTPAHDPELSAESSAASKPIFMVAGTTDGGSLCYTFYVHRSRYAGADLHLGVTVAFSAFLLAGLGIAAFRAAGRLPRHAAQAV